MRGRGSGWRAGWWGGGVGVVRWCRGAGVEGKVAGGCGMASRFVFGGARGTAFQSFRHVTYYQAVPRAISGRPHGGKGACAGACCD